MRREYLSLLYWERICIQNKRRLFKATWQLLYQTTFYSIEDMKSILNLAL